MALSMWMHFNEWHPHHVMSFTSQCQRRSHIALGPLLMVLGVAACYGGLIMPSDIVNVSFACQVCL